MIRKVKSVEELCNLINRSGLLKPADIQKLYKYWRRFESPGSPKELDRFVFWLTEHHYLTEYQAQQLLLGRADHFFLNHYKLLDLIGVGKMAGVFKASHILGHIVAIKLLPPAKARDTKLLARFQREARMAIKLKHPNIVRTYHIGNARGRHYIVMEYLVGETLEEVLQRRGKIPYPEAVRLIHQTLMGLQHIHEQGLVHRDLGPSNLMLVPPLPPGAPDNTLHATVKILDIGLGKQIFSERDSSEQRDVRLTLEGDRLGSAEYQSPEQAQDPHNVDIRSDIYAVGCILYHMIAGVSPFYDPDPIQQIIKHATEVAIPVRQYEPSVPEGLQNVIQRMLAKKPNSRYGTPAQAASALEPFLATQPDDEEELEESTLTRSYLKWVEKQPVEELNAEPAADERWMYRHNDETLGPVTKEELKQLAMQGLLKPHDPIWMEGDDPSVAIEAKMAIIFPAIVIPRKDMTAKNAVRAVAAVPVPKAILESTNTTKTETKTAHERIFEKARANLNHWVDQERNRRLILIGDMELIGQNKEIMRFMHYYKQYGEDFLHALWRHLCFMVENRRKYYAALS
ncbi:MAG: hypothetical protein KatS3mg105_3345 [Gemmatales bacterium]|nr:MAG: hypothetical protein KatS3mg105_3345 [Gemmatales bacterium]